MRLDKVEYSMPTAMDAFFSNQQVVNNEYVSIWFTDAMGKDFNVFYCPYCRNPLFEIRGKLVQILPGNQEQEPPLIIMCKRKSCGIKYHVHQILKKTI